MKSTSEIIAEIAEVLAEADGNFIADIANQVLTNKVEYVGDSLFEETNTTSMAELLIKKFKQNFPIGDETEEMELDNLDTARIIYDDDGNVVVENEHGTQFAVDSLSDEEIKMFLSVI